MEPHSGRGGHYYSLRTTAEEMSKKLDCAIVVIGKRESPVINQSKVKIYNLTYKKINTIKVIKDLKNIIDIERPQVIHSFDEDTFFFGSLISNILKKPYIHTKCGGPNSRIAFPKVNNLILFSQEDVRFYQSSRRFKKTNLFFIPNRIREIPSDILRIKNIKLSVDCNESKTFLIISRLEEYKKNDILQAINLVKKLNSDGIKTKLIIIGALQDVNVGKEIKENVDNNIYLFTDDKYAINASQLIDVADFVIGGGRSFMEAALKGKIMLCPLKNSNYPLLITEENFQNAFDQNFSSRLTIDNFDPEDNYKQIIQALIDEEYADNIISFIKSVSSEHFEISSQLNRYCKIYNEAKYKMHFSIFDMLTQYFRMVYCNELIPKLKTT
ncbi:glycosyltransferase [Methanosarcina barkeri]|nr:glycosyltransferase [Methanosarcina barkeri]